MDKSSEPSAGTKEICDKKDSCYKNMTQPRSHQKYQIRISGASVNTMPESSHATENQQTVSRKRNWYSTLSYEQKQEICKKRRESYAQKRKAGNATSNFQSPLIKCDASTGAPPLKKSRYSTLSAEKREELCRKKRESYHQNKLKNKIMCSSSVQRPPSKGQVNEKMCTSPTHKKNTYTHEKYNRIYDSSIHIQEPLPKGGMNECLCHNLKDKGKGHISYYSSFEIGSTSSANGNPDSINNKKRIGANTDGTKLLKNIPTKPATLPNVKPCIHCGAKKFYGEPKGFCCCDGEILLASNEPPDVLYYLYTSSSKDAKQFQTYIRTYNNTFAFTSFGVKYDKSLCKRNKGIYTFRAQGQVYHFINELLPNNTQPSYLQLYFYDTEHEVQNRMNLSSKLNSTILQRLIDILRLNPYASFFRTLENIPDLETHEIIIREDPTLDQRVYNAPAASQVGAIWLENNPCEQSRGRDIIVYNHVGFSHKVQHYYGCYDPLQYPLLFPHGDTGWHEGIKKREVNQTSSTCRDELCVDPHEISSIENLFNREEQVLQKGRRKEKQRKTVSCREYYCYKLQVRPSSLNLHASIFMAFTLLF